MADKNKCAHAGCGCSIPQEQAAKGSRYCSDQCEKSATMAAQGSSSCSCGHAGCQTQH